MPRRSSKRRERKSENKGSSRTTSRTRTKTSRRSRRITFDVSAASKEVAGEVVKRLGLDLIGIKVDDILDIIEDIVSGIVESRSTKPSIDILVKRILASKDSLRKAIAAKILAKRGEDLTLEQLEFVVSNAPELAGRYAPILYKIARKFNADHLIPALQSLWNRYGLRTPIRCPRCGFYAVTPELTCMICGATLDEEEIKRSINFKERLKSFLERSPAPIVREVYQAGFVVLNGEINSPSMAPRRGFRVEIHLSKDEKLLVRRILENKEGKGQS